MNVHSFADDGNFLASVVEPPGAPARPALFTPTGRFFLSDLVADPRWTIISASKLNERGEILAIAREAGTTIDRPVLLTPR